eukprot:9611830-Karenia_brevis.AAC.1
MIEFPRSSISPCSSSSSSTGPKGESVGTAVSVGSACRLEEAGSCVGASATGVGEGGADGVAVGREVTSGSGVAMPPTTSASGSAGEVGDSCDGCALPHTPPASDISVGA